MKSCKIIIFSLLFLCSSFCALPDAGALAAENDHRINVHAGASMEVPPDIAHVRCEISAKGATAGEASALAAEKMAAARRSLLGLNILSDDISNVNYSTGIDYDAKGKKSGYVAASTLKITVKDVARVGAVIDKLAGAGVEKIAGVSYGLSDKNLHRSQLLAQAVENARKQAAVVASAGGRTLGTLLYASFADVTRQENYNASERVMYAKAAGADIAVPTEINMQNITISVSVQTAFALL